MLNAELTLSGLVLVDPASQAFQKVLARLAPTDATVLIVGETGDRQRGGRPLSPPS